MKYTQVAQGYVLRFERGEELVESLHNFCEAHHVRSGWIQGLGGTTRAKVGYYNLQRKKYIFRSVKDARELVNLQGNISQLAESMTLHLHAVISDSYGKTRGGHLKELIVGGTVEVFIHQFDTELTRMPDAEIGLPLLQLDDDNSK